MPSHHVLQAAHRASSIHSPWKRSACDRCRGQKLRCDRKPNDIAISCIRCTRMGLICKTGSARPSNHSSCKFRSSTTSIDVAEMNEAIVLQQTHSTSATGGGVRLETPPSSSNATSRPIHASWPFIENEYSPVAAEYDVSLISQRQEEQYAINSFHAAGEHDMPPEADLRLNAEGGSLPASASSLLSFGLPVAPETDFFSVNGSDEFFSHLTASYTADSAEKDTALDSVESDPGILLANLQKSLTHELFLVKTTPWNLGNLTIAAGTCSAVSKSGGFNPLANILASTSEFLTLLRTFWTFDFGSTESDIPLEQHGASTVHNPTRRPNSRLNSEIGSASGRGTSSDTTVAGFDSSTPLIIHVLAIITCYLLIISTFDSILSQIIVKLADLRNSEDANSSGSDSHFASFPEAHSSPGLQQSGPEVIFAGQSIPLTARLGSRLLVQMVEYQLELLERIVGLPPPYCISTQRTQATNKRRGGETGILNHPVARPLILAVFSGDHPISLADSTPSKLVGSLKGNLKRAQMSFE